MHKHTKDVLEVKKIIKKVKEYAATEIGKNIISNLDEVSDLEYIKDKLDEITVAKELLENFGQPDLGGVKDLRDFIKKANKEIILTAEEILVIKKTHKSFKKLKNYFKNIVEETETRLIDNRYGIITEKGLNLEILYGLENKIDNCIDDHGNIKDTASSKLNSIRKTIKKTGNNIRDKLEDIIHSSKYQSMLQESLITKRENRYVVPVKHEYRNTFKGIVHDQSASGMTVFMEPMPVVELNNKIRDLKNQEEIEIYQILKNLSYEISDYSEKLKSNLKISSVLDIIFAKALYSREINGSAPDINTDGVVKIRQGRHPLLPKEPVPIDIDVGDGFNSLVITGPNTGGKTVSLKTVGLFVLMVKLGLHIPAESSSSIGLFSDVFADIGDEQSIEQNLSTFSSHMTKIKSYLNKADDNSLVLLDELGVGTAPREGAALGIAILEKLKENNAVTVATTHYSQLKSYAYSTKGAKNASVEFDMETLRPTYRLIMGVPGGSNAFEIAYKLGLPEDIIQKAKKLIDSSDLEVEEIIKDLNTQRKKYRELKEENEIKNARLKKIEKEYEEKLDKLKAQKEELIREAKQEAKDIVKRAQKNAKNLIKELKDNEFVSRSEVDRKATEINEKFKSISNDLKSEKDTVKKADKKPDIKPGDRVRIKTGGKKGEVLEIDKNEEKATIQAGIMKVNTKLSDLTKVDMPEKENEKIVKKYKVSKSSQITSRLDLRGKRYNEAQRELDKYLDDALLAGYNEVSIIHGKGSGALREAVQKKLEVHPGVSNFRLGEQNEGGSGVTIAKIKKD